ncbi:MAG: cytochrome c3 family protein, partial [Firmicutes bacterium]|nr:cytochrome c3 family protein [Bacillota bacterium]
SSTTPGEEGGKGEGATKAAGEKAGAKAPQEVSLKLSKSAKECGQCHEMLPEVTTWQLSSHSQLACTTCHKVNSKDYGSSGSTTLSRVITIKAEIKDEVCQGCHSPNRAVTPSGDLLIPHSKHAQRGITCVKCHSGVTHANVARRGVTMKEEYKDLSKWTTETAQAVFTKYYSQPSMWTCIDCHKSLKVTTKCSACHTAIPGLASHEGGGWRTGHGITARQDIGQCTKCHVIPGEPKFITPSTGDVATDFARANQFCYKCHKTKPASHTNTMLPDHPQLARNRGTQNCFACHSKEQPKPAKNVTATYCNQCHWFQEAAAQPKPEQKEGKAS